MYMNYLVKLEYNRILRMNIQDSLFVPSNPVYMNISMGEMETYTTEPLRDYLN